MRVRIVKKPVAADLEGFDVSFFEVGLVYEVGPTLGTLLIVAGYAEPEMRRSDRTSDQQKPS